MQWCSGVIFKISYLPYSRKTKGVSQASFCSLKPTTYNRCNRGRTGLSWGAYDTTNEVEWKLWGGGRDGTGGKPSCRTSIDLLFALLSHLVPARSTRPVTIHLSLFVSFYNPIFSLSTFCSLLFILYSRT